MNKEMVAAIKHGFARIELRPCMDFLSSLLVQV